MVPLILVDVHTLLSDKVATLDINILDKDETLHNGKDSWIWDTARKFAVSLMRTAIYLSAATLITSLIFYGIVVVGNVYQNPETRAQRLEGLNRFVRSVLMLVGSVLIMALLISFGRMLTRWVLNDSNSMELPIRVEAKEANRSFSTNITGFWRYKCQSTILTHRFWAMIIYCVCVLFNLLLTLFMFFRFFAIIAYSIYGIILTVINVFNIERLDRIRMPFLDWCFHYSVIVLCPVLLAMLQRLVLIIACEH